MRNRVRAKREDAGSTPKATGQTTDNAFVEPFNARLRQDRLNEHWFLTLKDAREKIETRRRDYRANRPRSSPDNMPPAIFANQCIPPAVATLQPSEHIGTTQRKSLKFA